MECAVIYRSCQMHHNSKLARQQFVLLIELWQRWFEGGEENGCTKVCFSLIKVVILQTRRKQDEANKPCLIVATQTYILFTHRPPGNITI